MPKQITLEEIRQKFKAEFVRDLGPNVEPVFSDPVGQVGPVINFITTYFTEFAEGLRLQENLQAYSTGNGNLFWNGYNQAKATLDEKINAALNKPSI